MKRRAFIKNPITAASFLSLSASRVAIYRNRFIETKGGVEGRMRNPSFFDSRIFEKLGAMRNCWNLRWLAYTSLLLLLGVPGIGRTAHPDGDNKYVLERENRTI